MIDMTPERVRHNAYMNNLGTDWIAVDAEGNIVVRADSEQAARSAMPHAAAFYSAADFKNTGKPTQPAPAAPPPTADPVGFDMPSAHRLLDEDSNKKPHATAKHADGDAFDHDHNGRVGGSKAKTTKTK